MIVIATGFIPLDNGYTGKQHFGLKEYCAEYWLKDLQENMDRYAGCCDIPEILLKMAETPNNQSCFPWKTL